MLWARIDVFEREPQCIAATAIGMLTMTAAEDTTRVHGGRLAFHGTLDLYYPTETPYGDLSSGFPLCPKQ